MDRVSTFRYPDLCMVFAWEDQRSRKLFPYDVMIEADDTRNLPGAVRVMPKVDESGLARRRLGFGMVETVNADLDSAIALH